MMLFKHRHHPSSSSSSLSTFEFVRILLVSSVWLMGTYNAHCKPYKINDRQHVVAPWIADDNIRPFDGVCGNGLLDDVSDKGNKISTSPFKGKQTVRNKTDGLKQEKHNRLEIVPQNWSNQLIQVRLNIFYDVTMAHEFGVYSGGGASDKLLRFVRNLIYETQLIFEQPEIYPYLKVNFIVVKLIQSRANYYPHLDLDEMLEAFPASADIGEFGSADLNILLTYNNLWKRIRNEPPRKILGVARVGTFCRGSVRDAVLLLSARAISAAITLAHEIAHTLDSNHDGDPIFGHDCNPAKFIMSPTNGPEKLSWSKCSVGSMMSHLSANARCVFDPQRLASSRLLSEYFDFNLDASNAANRGRLPGIEFDLDDQCALALDSTARSLLNVEQNNGDDRYETCQNLVCTMGKYMQVSLGPAITGSRCSVKASQAVFGSCFQGFCSTKYSVVKASKQE